MAALPCRNPWFPPQSGCLLSARGKTPDPPEPAVAPDVRRVTFLSLQHGWWRWECSTKANPGSFSPAPLTPGEPLAAIHFPPVLDLGPPLQLLMPWSALDQAGVPLSGYCPLNTQKLLDSIFPMVRGAPPPLSGLHSWVMNG